MKDLRGRKIAVIRNASQPYSDFLGTHFAADVRAVAPNVIVTEYTIIDGFADAKGLMDRVLATGPDLIFVPLEQVSIAAVFAELEARGSRVTLLSSDMIEKKPQFLSQLGPNSRKIRLIYPQHWSGKLEGPQAAKYQHLLKRHCGQYTPSMTSVAAYDAAELLVRALRRNPALRAERLISAVRKDPYHGMTGRFVYGADGDPIKPLELFQLKNGKVSYWMRYE